MSEEEKIAEAGTVKERGNAKFKAGLWKSAIKRYEKASKLIDFDKNFKDENLKKSTEIKRSCNLNLAAAQLKLGAFKKAVEACNQVVISVIVLCSSDWRLCLPNGCCSNHQPLQPPLSHIIIWLPNAEGHAEEFRVRLPSVVAGSMKSLEVDAVACRVPLTGWRVDRSSFCPD